MTKFISTLTASTALFLFTACSPAAEAPVATSKSKTSVVAAQAPAMDTKVKAVRIYADWCGNCKVLDAKLETIRAAHAFRF